MTHNYVSRANLGAVLEHLATGNGELVSGCPDEDREGLYGRFVEAMEREEPAVMAAERGRAAAREAGRGASLAGAFRRAEQEQVAAGGFTFNFT